MIGFLTIACTVAFTASRCSLIPINVVFLLHAVSITASRCSLILINNGNSCTVSYCMNLNTACYYCFICMLYFEITNNIIIRLIISAPLTLLTIINIQYNSIYISVLLTLNISTN